MVLTNNLSKIRVSLVISKSIWPSHDEDSNIDSHSKAENWNHHLWSVKTTKISDDIGLWHSPINEHRHPQSNAAILQAPSSSSSSSSSHPASPYKEAAQGQKAQGTKIMQTTTKITLKYWDYDFFIVSNMILVISYISNMILVISYRNDTDKAERNPSLVYMKDSLGLIFKIKWNNTKNSSRRKNSTNDELRTLLFCLRFSFLLKVSIKSTITQRLIFWSRKVFEGVHITCETCFEKASLVHFFSLRNSGSRVKRQVWSTLKLFEKASLLQIRRKIWTKLAFFE